MGSQVVLLQTAQSWANAGVCGGLCTCPVSGTYNRISLHCCVYFIDSLNEEVW